jgi:hypothetical protein
MPDRGFGTVSEVAEVPNSRTADFFGMKNDAPRCGVWEEPKEPTLSGCSREGIISA